MIGVITISRIILVQTLCLLLLSLFVPSVLAQTDNPQSGSAGLTGVIPSPPPTVGATISFPTNGQTFTQIPIDVTGVCPNGLTIRLFKNNIFSGSTSCSGGNWTITTDLFTGSNQLVARVYDALDQAGPDSNRVTVTFNDGSSTAIGQRVSIISNFATRGANPGERLTWPLIISGGRAPYAVMIDWGDGTDSLISRPIAGDFVAANIYDKAGVYKVTIKVTDADGQAGFLQVISVAHGEITGTAGDGGGTGQPIVYRWAVIPILVMFLLTIPTFWIGRRYENRKLRELFASKGMAFTRRKE